jgi:hypothetical protein
MSKRYKSKRRFRYYAQREICQRCGHHPATLCYLPGPPRTYGSYYNLKERSPDEVLCGEHASLAGYCRCCGDFWGGIDSFEFGHPGLCDQCHDQIEADFAESEYEEDYDFSFYADEIP